MAWIVSSLEELPELEPGTKIRIDTQAKHGQAYDASLVWAERTTSPRGWWRVIHRREGFDHDTVNVLPRSTLVYFWHQ